VAADLLAQCEHRFDSCAVLISPSRALLAAVKIEVEKQVKRLPTKTNAWRSWTERGALVLTRSIEESIALSNLIAPEHLELHLDNPLALLGDVKNAGCVLLGVYSPAAISDYLAGPSHCLPTGRTATFSSGLGVMDFMKYSGVVSISKACLAEFEEDLREFTAVEGLEAHYRAVQQRLRKMAAKKMRQGR
jgi:histidinol dehydrogenase